MTYSPTSASSSSSSLDTFAHPLVGSAGNADDGGDGVGEQRTNSPTLWNEASTDTCSMHETSDHSTPTNVFTSTIAIAAVVTVSSLIAACPTTIVTGGIAHLLSIVKRVVLSSLLRAKHLINGVTDEKRDDEKEQEEEEEDNEKEEIEQEEDEGEQASSDSLLVISEQQQPPIAETVVDSEKNYHHNNNKNMNLLRLLEREQDSDNETDRSAKFGKHGIPNDQLVLVYALEMNAFNKSKLFRCEKFNYIRFHLAPSLYGRPISLFTNYCDDFTQFDRETYREIPIKDARNMLQMQSSGSYHFYYSDSHKPKTIFGSFYIVVNPVLTIFGGEKKSAQTLSINAIQCQTLLSKCMGPIDTWPDKLRVSLESGYNMIHWTPIQELGGSRSAYSLANQHRVNPTFRSAAMIESGRDCTLDDIGKIVDELRVEHGVLSITDIVLNHTANESAWLREHPDATYNCANSPWLRPAFLLDRLFWHLTLDIEDGRWIETGIVATGVNTERHLEKIRSIFIDEYLPMIRFEEFYLCDEKKLIQNFEQFLIKFIFGVEANSKSELDEKAPIKNHPSKAIADRHHHQSIELIQDPEYRPLSSRIDFDKTLTFLLAEVDFVGSIDDRDALFRWIDFALLHLEKTIAKLNQTKRDQINAHLISAVDNVIKGARYERIDSAGPKIAIVSKRKPIATQYFTDEINGHENKDIVQIQQSLFDDRRSCFYMAHNGWVMGDDPLRNFAEQDSWVYLRRELICWADSVKLRYGAAPEDSPFLWKFMREYVTRMASTFHGLRLDNCHSTPIHVAKHMLDAARRVNPDLYLIAELFTSNESVDNIFINKLGINSLIREAMSAPTAFELGRQVYRFGGEPVGSFSPDDLKTSGVAHGGSPIFMRPFVPTVAHAILFDATHDNESPIIRRTVYDTLASSGLVAMTYCAIGSNRGFDELVPHHIHVVKEERQYAAWQDGDNDDDEGDYGVNRQNGIIDAKRALNDLHQFLSDHGYSQSFVDQRDRDTVVVTRHNPHTHRSVILAARTAFTPIDEHAIANHSLRPLEIEGKFEKIILEARLSGAGGGGECAKSFVRNEHTINGFRVIRSEVRSMLLESSQSEMIEVDTNARSDTGSAINSIRFKSTFVPSSVVAFSMSLLDDQRKSLDAIHDAIKQYDARDSVIINAINELDFVDLNYVLFRTNQEEMDESGNGVYNLSSGPFTYCGLAGMMTHLTRVRTHNDLGHPLCGNLRDGDWLPQYIVARLKRRSSTAKLAQWLEQVFHHLSRLPRYLIPRYFDSILLPLYTLLLDRTWSLSSEFVRHGDDFVRKLAFGGLALIGSHSPSPLPPLASASIPATLRRLADGRKLPSLAAGFPHFASGYMRNWGRDTFIALKGLTLLTGQFDIAKVIILGFAGTLRHGLIPNLLDGGRNSRYNCRDSVWWWLQAIKDYILAAPDGHAILREEVRRIFPTDDSPAMIDEEEDSSKVTRQPLHDTIQEALDRHFAGIDFVERNAGTRIDAHMTAEGFHIKIGVDRETGFVYGGNQWNCGTWMDKMGSSDRAANRGHPATPRDGSPVEIIGLCKSVISFFADLHRRNQYPYDGVRSKSDEGSVIETCTFEQWAEKIQANFESHFYVDTNSTESYANRRQIYKDTIGATKRWMDFQLRPNFLVAMCVAPELFDRDHAIAALEIVDQHLLGPLGMRTLDPSDLNYRGDYDNSNDSDDYLVAHGFNYHNGPEWLWPIGYYFMARLKFIPNHSHESNRIGQLLAKHYEHLSASEWYGLPELTNSNGSTCAHSCTIQAWSHATLLELLHLKQFIERNMFD